LPTDSHITVLPPVIMLSVCAGVPTSCPAVHVQAPLSALVAFTPATRALQQHLPPALPEGPTIKALQSHPQAPRLPCHPPLTLQQHCVPLPPPCSLTRGCFWCQQTPACRDTSPLAHQTAHLARGGGGGGRRARGGLKGGQGVEGVGWGVAVWWDGEGGGVCAFVVSAHQHHPYV